MDRTSTSDTIVKEITIKAPAARIFEALSNPAHRVKWWGAEGRCQTTHMESDLRPGGKWMMHGVGMGGKPFRMVGEYRNIERPTLAGLHVASRLAGECAGNSRALGSRRERRRYD